MTLTTSYSLWLSPLCIALGVLAAWLLYRRTPEQHGWSPALQWGLGAARSIVIAVLAFFLLEPMVRIFLREVRKPVIVLAHDGSSSLLATGDTTALRSSYKAALAGLSEKLGADFEVRTFTYGSEVKEGLDFAQAEGRTDIDRVFREVYDRFAGPDLGAVIIDGDGIFNTGRDPRLAAERLGVPVYTIALGDTTVRPDLVLRNVDHNRITYLGNEFPVVVRLEARHFSGIRTRISILREGKELTGKDHLVQADPEITEIPFMVKADRPGLQRLIVRVAEREGESSTDNNEQTIYVDVLDGRQKILLLAQAPHPDVAALRESLNALDGYATEVAYSANFNGTVDGVDLVVLHQLPANGAAIQPVLKRIIEKNIPTWTIIGQNTDFNQLNAFESGLELTNGQRMVNDAQASVNPDFALFNFEAEEVRAFERFPPLQVPIGTYAPARGAATLLFQKVGVVRTKYPLFLLQPNGERHSAILCGEGLWRWRLADQQLFNTRAHFDRLVHKTATYLALKQDKSRFRVRHPQEFAQNDKVVIEADLYNASYEPVNTPEAAVRLTDENGNELVYAFSRKGSGYILEAGSLPPGRYAWAADTELDRERLTAKGEFLVKELVAERMSTIADHGLWEGISARTKGSMTRPDDVGRILESIAAKKTIVARSYAHASFSDLIGLRWIFFLLLGLLTVEWALRRRSGTY